MTAAELIAILQALPPETRVLVTGYEGDLDDPCAPVAVRVNRKDGAPFYIGLYEEADNGNISAIVLHRDTSTGRE